MSSDSVPSPAGQIDSAALVMRIAGRPGPTFVLRTDRDNTLGRSPDATIVVADRLASRIHAVVRFDPEQSAWVLHDLGSRNGTCLDGATVTSAVISDGAVVRVGTSELAFRLLPAGVPDDSPADRGQFVRRGHVSELEGSVLRRTSAGSTDDVRRPLLLYQASLRLLASRSIREVIETALALASEHSGSASVGWFRVVSPDRLEPMCVVPPGNALAAAIDPATATLVARDGQAVWTAAASQPAGVEIACVPMLEAGRVHAALAAAASPGAMRAVDFDFLVALASLASAACSGHASSSPRPEAADLGSQQTVGLDSVLLLDEGGDNSTGATGILASAEAAETLTLDEESLQHLIQPGAEPSASRIGSFVAETGTLRLDDWQRILVIEALRRTGGSLPGAASELGISRATLCRTLELYGLRRR